MSKMLQRIKMFNSCFFRHIFYWLKGDKANLTISNGVDVEYTIAPMVCLHCKKVEWRYVKGNL